ncbi:hypothetical protein [Enterococcus larvae]|uniref:hypothetical protein n=1 Tax=Enterococcus larvae TaxID=2794352 RepID=UPI003F3DB087
MEERYIVIGPGSDYVKHIFLDIDNLENGIVFAAPIREKSYILSKLHHIHFSLALNRKMDLPFKGIWDNYYSLSQVAFDKDIRYYLIFTDISACRYSFEYLHSLSQKKNITLGLTILNIMSDNESLLRNKLPLFDYIFSFDKNDAEQYNFIFWPLIYSNSKYEVTNTSHSNRAFFAGNAKKRLETIHGLFSKLTEMNVSAEFYVSKVPEEQQRYAGNPHFHYNQWLDYQTILQETLSSEYVVEIVDDNQNGLTLRSAEAICMNKRIVTNNQSIKLSEFYDPSYVHVFKDPEDIDIEFFKQDLNVDYHYDGSFSPVRLIEYMKTIK